MSYGEIPGKNISIKCTVRVLEIIHMTCVLFSLNFSLLLLPRYQISSIWSVAFISKSGLVTIGFLIFIPGKSHCSG